jgi:hypothetical protein
MGVTLERLEGRVLLATQVYEAEAARISGAVFSNAYVGTFTGSGFIDYQKASGEFIEWTVSAASAGDYFLDVRYANQGVNTRPLELKINGSANGQMSFPSTGNWRTWKTVGRRVTLSAGTHKVRLTSIGSSGPNIDSLTVRSAGTTPPPTGALQAESARISGAVVSNSNSGYTGSGFVDYAHASGDFIEWTVNAASARSYELAFRYANGFTANRPLELKVNGQVVKASMAFAPSGNWSTWALSKAITTLRQGANTVRLTAIGVSGPNVDSLTVTPKDQEPDPDPDPGPGETIRSLRVYHIGNSLTNGIGYGSLDGMAAADGREYMFGRHVIPGAPLSWIWDHPDGGNRTAPFGRSRDALAQNQWDVLTLQPFDRQLYASDGSGDVQVAKKFIDLAMRRSPKLQTYIYQRWPRRTQNADGSFASYDYEKLWLRSYTGKWDRTYETRDYFNQVVRELHRTYPNAAKPVRMIPVGEVMFELNRRIKAGQVPGIRSIEELFFDHIHLNNWGGFLIGTTFYSTMYQRDPRGLDFRSYNVIDDPWDRPINEGFARAVQNVVWDVVRANPFTGL